MKKTAGRRNRRWLDLIYVFCLSCLPFLSCLFCSGSMARASSDSEGLFVRVFDVGEGLAVYCECGEHALIYDGGGRDTASRVVNEVRGRGVRSLDYAVVSHYDDDHLAGVIGALHVFDCGMILAPDYIGTTSIYTSFRSLVEERGFPCEAPAVGNVYSLGDAQIEVLAPDGFSAEQENDRCIAIRILYGNNALILCGDAGEEEELGIANGSLEAASDVYVVDHHGSSSSSTPAFLDRVLPAYAVISCGQGNDFGHPHETVLRRLADRGIRVYRTDRQGDICFRMDGERIFFDREPTADLTPGTRAENAAPVSMDQGNSSASENEAAQPDGDSCRYICNFRTFIFHRPDCETVARMSEKNKVYSNEGREELIALGYRACGICRP